MRAAVAAVGGVILACGLLCAPLQAQERPPIGSEPPPTSPTTFDDISPTIAMFGRLASDAVDDPPLGELDGATTMGVHLRLGCYPDAETFATLRAAGLTFPDTDDGVPDTVADSGIYRASVDIDAIDQIDGAPCIDRLEPANLPGRIRPLNKTTADTGARAAHYRPDGRVDGRGTTIALLDSPVDILHPAFFLPDGGRFRWIDVDGDGSFAPSRDAVDLNRNGKADSNERLHVLDATTVVDAENGKFDNRDGAFQAGRDWLYADMNGDGKRNAGPADGFKESDPAYGEPLFVVDDVDRDGALEPDERLYRLDSSKIERMVLDDGTYVRGDDLIEAAAGELPTRAIHGTSVAGILVGGQLGFHKRVGVAPRAELVVVARSRELQAGQATHLEGLETAEKLGADVFLTEWSNPFLRPIDGSTNLERALAAARDRGMAQVAPLGNLNISQKHILETIPAREETQLPFTVPKKVKGFEGERTVDQVFGTLQWRGEHKPSIWLATPDSRRRKLAPNARTTIGDVEVESSVETTPAGTSILTFYIRRPKSDGEPGPLPSGDWRFDVGKTDATTTLVGRITDSYSGWGLGVRWQEPTEDRMTISFPASQPATIGVAAYAGRASKRQPSDAPGDLRTFSARGPNLLGDQVVDLAAPDNPYVPLAATPRVEEAGWGSGWFHEFSGTSGAAPHVAGAFSLLREMSPKATVDELETRLIETTDRQELFPEPSEVPGPGWGFGRLRIHRALYGDSPAQNHPPRADLEVRFDDTDILFDGSASSDPDGDRLAYRFDLDHDGDWDTTWQSEPVVERDAETFLGDRTGPRVARLEVRDEHGMRAGALAILPPEIASDDAGYVDAGADTSDTSPGSSANAPNSTGLFRCSAPPNSRGSGRISLLLHLLGLLSLVRWRRRAGR